MSAKLKCEKSKITQYACQRPAYQLRSTGKAKVWLCKQCDEKFGNVVGFTQVQAQNEFMAEMDTCAECKERGFIKTECAEGKRIADKIRQFVTL